MSVWIALALVVAPAQVIAPSDTLAQLAEVSAAIHDAAEPVEQLSPLIRRTMAAAASPEAAAVAAREIKPSIAQMRAAIQRSSARLANIPASDVALVGDMSLRRIIAEIVAQNDATVALFDDMQLMMEAVARRDAPRAKALAERLMQGSVLLVRNQATILRVRQAATDRDDPTHQSLGVMVGVYRAMATVLAQRITLPPKAGDDLPAITRDIRSLVSTGRVNLARERSTLTQIPADQRAIVAGIYDLDEEGFTIGEEVASVLTTLPATAASAKVGEVAARLVVFEGRLQDLVARQVEAAQALE